MANQYTPEQLKDMLIEYHVLKWGDTSFVQDVAMSSLEKMCMLDAALLEDDEMEIPYTEPSLVAALNHDYYDVRREEFLKNEMERILKEDKSLLRDTSALVDMELNILGYPAMAGNPLMLKVNIIVQQRLRSMIDRVKAPQMPASRMSPDFKCYLVTLEGGCGDRRKKTRLYFDYRTSFVHFISSLHDETKQSTIPPLKSSDPDGPDTQRRASIISLSESPERGSATDTLKSAYLELRTVRKDPRTSIEPIFRARNENDRGYTLLDGPWVCCFLYGPELGQERIPIVDEVSYNAIVSKVKKHNVENAKGNKEVSIMVMHAMDYQAEQEARFIQRREQDYRDRKEEDFQEACRRGEIIGVDPEDEDDFGEPYVEWLMKDLREQKMAKAKAEAAASQSSSSQGIPALTSFQSNVSSAAAGTPASHSGPSNRGGTSASGSSSSRSTPSSVAYDSPTPAHGAARALPLHLTPAASSNGRQSSDAAASKH